MSFPSARDLATARRTGDTSKTNSAASSPDGIKSKLANGAKAVGHFLWDHKKSILITAGMIAASEFLLPAALGALAAEGVIGARIGIPLVGRLLSSSVARNTLAWTLRAARSSRLVRPLVRLAYKARKFIPRFGKTAARVAPFVGPAISFAASGLAAAAQGTARALRNLAGMVDTVSSIAQGQHGMSSIMSTGAGGDSPSPTNPSFNDDPTAPQSAPYSASRASVPQAGTQSTPSQNAARALENSVARKAVEVAPAVERVAKASMEPVPSLG